jgi:hypothetical protein
MPTDIESTAAPDKTGVRARLRLAIRVARASVAIIPVARGLPP